jgi:hypothetical protein
MTVDEYLAKGGKITRCPPAIVGATTAVLPDEVRRFHAERWDAEERRKQNETAYERRSRVMKGVHRARKK